MFYENSDFSPLELIAKEVVMELENWWKNKIDDFEVAKDNLFEFDIILKTDDLKKVLYIERMLKDILSEVGCKITNSRIAFNSKVYLEDKYSLKKSFYHSMPISIPIYMIYFQNFWKISKKLNFRRGCERVACPPGRLQKIPQNRPKFTYIKYVKDEIENSKNISIKKIFFKNYSFLF